MGQRPHHLDMPSLPESEDDENCSETEAAEDLNATKAVSTDIRTEETTKTSTEGVVVTPSREASKTPSEVSAMKSACLLRR